MGVKFFVVFLGFVEIKVCLDGGCGCEGGSGVFFWWFDWIEFFMKRSYDRESVIEERKRGILVNGVGKCFGREINNVVNI